MFDEVTVKLGSRQSPARDGALDTVRMQVPAVESQRHDSALVSSCEPGTMSVLADQYEVVQKIGAGGMGVVSLARDRRIGRYVAVKRLNNEALESPSLRARFLREAQAMAALNHVYIIHLYALGEDSLGPFMVMEYVTGTGEGQDGGDEPPAPLTLAERVSRNGPLPLDEALDLMLKIAGAICYAHRRDVIHRDLKPTNVLLDACGEPKIVDFGLARMASDQANPLTLPGEKMLSMGYGAPEQETDASLTDERVDVYGLGALLYFCLTGRNPRYFRANDVPEVLRLCVSKALETSRDRRWPTAEAFSDALRLIHSPRASGISTSKTTWRCKWCEAENPVLIRYCGECGWDGGTTCDECGSESRFGIQFCGVCGADAKAYEAAVKLLDELETHRHNLDFSTILQKEKQIGSFTPQGMNGRRIIERINELGQEAGAALRRRVALAGAIEREQKAGHYEHVRDYIGELNTLTHERNYEALEKHIDSLIADRDASHLRTLIKNAEWRGANALIKRVPESIIDTSDTLQRLQQRIRRHIVRLEVLRIVAVLSVFLFLYGASYAPASRLLKPGPDSLMAGFYAPVRALEKRGPFSAVLSAYSRLWGVDPAS